jgi:hypothetical protein
LFVFPLRWFTVSGAFLVLLLTGCGPADRSVSGTVTFQGQPLDTGTIQFYQTGASSVVSAGATINGGKYEIPNDHGLKPGTYLVRITSPEVGGAANAKATFEKPFPAGLRERIPAKYNTQSKLTVDVRAGEKSRFDFTLD